MTYFFFSFSHEKRGIRATARMGRWLLMISFGAFFGNAIMTRMAIFLERVKFLTNDWARNRDVMTWQWGIVAAALVFAIGLIHFFTRPRPKPPGAEESEDELAPAVQT